MTITIEYTNLLETLVFMFLKDNYILSYLSKVIAMKVVRNKYNFICLLNSTETGCLWEAASVYDNYLLQGLK